MNIEERLENWARAVRFRCRRGHAMSFEGNYRSPQRNHWDTPVIPIAKNINADDAWKVEAAWATLPAAARIILRCHYCLHWPEQRTCRFLSKSLHVEVKPYDYGKLRLESQDAIALSLERSESQNRNIVRSVIKKVLAIPATLGYTAD